MSGPREAESTDPRSRLMVAFEGERLSAAAERRLREAPAAGLSLFRYLNVAAPGQVRELTEAAQRAHAAGGHPGPLLVATDQEGGQLIALGDGTTPFAGPMALGAAADLDLAERVAFAIGTELLAMGLNVAYAPVCDLATNPANPAMGIRSFGDDPATVAAFAAATVRGLRASGAAATMKHFPGLGQAALDSHHGLPSLPHDRARLDGVELVPFRSAIEAGADLAMSAHVALERLTGDPELPATLARGVMHDLLREGLGFRGLTITDALDMAALPQEAGLGDAVVAALEAGVDLLLAAPDPGKLARIDAALVQAAARGRPDPGGAAASMARLAALRSRLAAAPEPPLDVVGGRAHRALARELAERSLTLVRDVDGRLPLRLGPGDAILAVMPTPRELTPADTSASVPPGLAAALRSRWPHVREVVTGHPPTDDEIAGVVAAAHDAAVVVVGTIVATADPQQVRLVEALVATRRPLVTVSLRTPWDAAAYPSAGTHVAAYGLLQPTLVALAGALFGDRTMPGRLPVAVAGAEGPTAGVPR